VPCEERQKQQWQDARVTGAEQTSGGLEVFGVEVAADNDGVQSGKRISLAHPAAALPPRSPRNVDAELQSLQTYLPL
jgi:hypothetical protein